MEPEVIAAIPAWLDYAALVVGSVAGAVEAHARRLDFVGHVGLSMLCGLGGGLIRDTVMQVGTANVYMISSRYAILIATLVGMAVYLFPRTAAAHPNLLEWLDIVSVGLFCVVGTNKAIAYELNLPAVLLMGTLTGVGGGMLRDVFLGDVPRIFQSSNLYAVCALLGSAVFALCAGVLGLEQYASAAACVATVVALRRLSLRFHLRTTPDVNLEDHVITQARRARDKVIGRDEQDGQ